MPEQALSPTQSNSPKQSKVDGYPCPECSAPLALKPGTESLACDHCGKVVPIQVTKAEVPSYDLFGKRALEALTAAALTASAITAGGREVQCKTCGARAISNRQADRCAFCDSPMVVEVDASDAAIPPGGVLPFVVDRHASAEKFQHWLKTRWFAPSDLVKRSQRDGMDGVYQPYWAYDTDGRADYTGERGDYYYETETYTENGETKTREVRHTRWHSASGSIDVAYDDVLICASPSLPAKIIQKLEPWDLPAVRAFTGEYLAGFAAERYRVEVSDGFKLAYERIEPKIRAEVKHDIGGDEQRIASLNVDWRSVDFRHLLLPLWLSSFRYNDKVFHVTVNARTGEIAGERPWSWVKIMLLVVMIAAAIAAIVILIERSKH